MKYDKHKRSILHRFQFHLFFKKDTLLTFPHKHTCIFYFISKNYFLILDDFLSYFLNLFIGDTCYSFSQLLSSNSSTVIHQIISQSLSQIVLSLVLKNLNINTSFCSLKLFICYFVRINLINQFLRAYP